MTRPRRVVIAGVAQAELRDGVLADGATVLQAQARVVDAALRDAGLRWADVDGLATTGTWGVPGVGSWPTIALSEYLGVQPRFSDSTALGGASFEAHVGHTALALLSGQCSVAVITYGSTQRSDRSRSLSGRPPHLIAQYETIWGLLAPVGAYAMAAHRYLWEFGGNPERLAAVAVAARDWARLNPAATARDPLTVDDVLASDLVSDPLHRLDCCLVTDGAGAVVLTTDDRLPDLAGTPVFVDGWAEHQSHLSITHMPDLTRTGAAVTGPAALAMAGMTHADIDVVEVYDSFTISVPLALESLGFCPRGSALDFVADGHTLPGGDFPLNTSGGGLSHAHPGMYGIFLLIEAVLQLRGEADARQVAGARTALVNGTGGVLSSNATCVLSRD